MTAGTDKYDFVLNEYKQLVRSTKDYAKEKLANYDWMRNMRLKAGQYIENNGPNTTQDEVTDFLMDEAFKTFPCNLMDEIVDKLELEIADIMMTCFKP